MPTPTPPAADSFSNHPAGRPPPRRPSTGPARRRNFASDNASGVCPEAWAAMAEANAAGHLPSYGADPYTQRAADAFRRLFETDCDVYFVFNGTAANSLALASLCQSYHSVVCHETAHVETDECGAPEFYSNGSKLLPCPGPLGKLTPAPWSGRSSPSGPTSTTPARGPCRSPPDRAGHDLRRRRGRRPVGRGPRAGAAGPPGRGPVRQRRRLAGVHAGRADVAGGRGRALLRREQERHGRGRGGHLLRPPLSEEFAARCKQAGQLASKMRFLAAPWVGMLQGGAWLGHAAHANAMAQRLAAGLGPRPRRRVLHPVQANSVFVDLPAGAADALRARGWLFYSFIGGGGRLMCSWDTRPADVDALLADLADVTAR